MLRRLFHLVILVYFVKMILSSRIVRYTTVILVLIVTVVFAADMLMAFVPLAIALFGLVALSRGMRK